MRFLLYFEERINSEQVPVLAVQHRLKIAHAHIRTEAASLAFPTIFKLDIDASCCCHAMPYFSKHQSPKWYPRYVGELDCASGLFHRCFVT